MSLYLRPAFSLAIILIFAIAHARYTPALETNAFAWGPNTEGQLGRGMTSPAGGPAPITVPLAHFVAEPEALTGTYPPQFEMIAVGSTHAIATSDSGTKLWVWGSGGAQLGLYFDEFVGNLNDSEVIYSFPYRLQPILVPKIDNFTYPVTGIAANASQSWILDAQGRLFVSGGFANNFYVGYFHPYEDAADIRFTSGVACATLCIAWNETGFWNGADWEVKPNFDLFGATPFGTLVYVAISDGNTVITDGAVVFARGDNSNLQISSNDSSVYFEDWILISPTPSEIFPDSFEFTKVAACETLIMALNHTTIYAKGDLTAPLWSGNQVAASELGNFTQLPLFDAVDIGCVGTANVAVYKNEEGTHLLLTWGGWNPNQELGRSLDYNINSTVAYDARPANMSTQSGFGVAINVGSATPQPVPIAMAWGSGIAGQLGTGEIQLGSLPSPVTAFTPDYWGNTSTCTFLGGNRVTILDCAYDIGYVGDYSNAQTIDSDGSPLYPSFLDLASSLPNCTSPLMHAVSANMIIVMCPDDGSIAGFGNASDPILTAYNTSRALSPAWSLQCGYYHCGACYVITCVIWGDNTYHQVSVSAAATDMATRTGFFLALGGTFSIAWDYGTILWSGWGQPSAFTELLPLSQVAAGYSHALFLNTTGAIYVMGSNEFGQLGFAPPSTNPSSTFYLTPTAILPGITATSIAAVWNTSFFINSHGNVYSFGASGLYATHGLPSISITPWIPRQLDLGGMRATSLCQTCRGESMFAFLDPTSLYQTPSYYPAPLGQRFRISMGPNFLNQNGVGVFGNDFPRAVPSNVSVRGTASSPQIGLFPWFTTSFAISTSGGLLEWGAYSNPDRYNGGELDGLRLDGLEHPTTPSFSNVASIGGFSPAIVVLSDNTSYTYNSSDSWSRGTWYPDEKKLKAYYGPFFGVQSAFWERLNGSVATTNDAVGVPSSMPLFIDQLVYSEGDIIGWLANGTLNINGSVIFNITSISVAPWHAMALSKSGSVWTYALFDHGQLLIGVWPSLTDTFYKLNLPAPVTQIGALTFGSVALDVNNSVWYWGRNLANGDSGFWSHVPWYFRPVQLTWVPKYLNWLSSIQPTATNYSKYDLHLLTSSRTTHLVLVDPVIDHPPPPSPPPPAPILAPAPPAPCAGVAPPTLPPGVNATITCSNGVWIVAVDIVSTQNSSIVITGPTIVTGTVIVPPQTTLTLIPSANSSSPLLVIEGCANISGTLGVTLDNDTFNAILTAGGSRQLGLVQAQCGQYDGSVSITQPVTCHKAHAGDSQVTANETYFYLSVAFHIDSSECNTWIIILASVIGGVVLIVIGLVLLVIFNPTVRAVFRPFTKLRKGKGDSVHPDEMEMDRRLTHHEATVPSPLYQDTGNHGSNALYRDD